MNPVSKLFSSISGKSFFILVSILIALQLFVFIADDHYNKQAEKNDLKNLLLQQTMLFIQRLQVDSSTTQQEIIKNHRLPNEKITITPFPEWQIQVNSHALWPIYNKLKHQKDFIRLSIQLVSGKWLNIEISPSPAKLLVRSFLIGFEIFVAVCSLIFLGIIFRYTIPLQTITEAAKKLGLDVNVTPLQPKGSLVVRNTFQAINDMQEKIQYLIQERTNMLAAISHDLRTPLTRMRLRTDFIEDAQQQLKNNRDIDEMETMITQILSFAKEDHQLQQKTNIDLSALVISLCHDFSDSGHAVKYIGCGNRLLFLGSSLALKRAISNVIENAIKYAGFAEVNLFLNHKINLIITDQGPGISSDHIDKVFEPFYRVDSSRSRKTGGSGLGLTIARNIIRSHNGSIAIKKSDEKGLQVIISLPFAQ